MHRATLYTIGHSSHSFAHFLSLLRQHEVEAVADVRSIPYSRFNPQYNRETLKQSLLAENIHYVFLGRELGAKREEQECYHDKKLDFSLVRQLPVFLSGIDRLLDGVAKMRVAIMCAEKQPHDCHRSALIARHLEKSGIEIAHILADASVLAHGELAVYGKDGEMTADLFSDTP